MERKLLCVSGALNGFTSGKFYTIVPNAERPSFEKWVYDDNGMYIHIPTPLMNLYFELLEEEEKSEIRAMDVNKMNINELYQLQGKLNEQINKEVLKAIKEVNDTMELLKDNLDVLFSVCQMFDIKVDDYVGNLQNELLTVMYDTKEKCVFN